jgi:hypothetical protein
MDGWNETDGGLVYAEDLEYRDMTCTRERWGGNLSSMPGCPIRTELYLRGVYSQVRRSPSCAAA